MIEAPVTVRDKPQASRYELLLDGSVVGELVHRQRPRCGASGNKPFCDGTHRTIDFRT